MTIEPCRECSAPASVSYRFSLRAVGFDGSDGLIWLERWCCVQGHHYDLEVA